jgi:hypothetical protein
MPTAVIPDTITEYFLEAAERGVMHAAEHVAGRAKTLAPVRKLFASEKRGRGVHTVQTLVPGKWSTTGQLETVNIKEAISGGSRWKNRIGQEAYLDIGRTGKIGDQRIRGRVNSYAPVVMSPAGLIGGVDLRRWQTGSGGLAIDRINKPGGGSFKLADLLTSHGRYEVATGRAVHKGLIGGRLRDSIKTEGPRRSGMQVSGFVSASASDPGSSHNYARDQEFGTRRSVKHPFLRPALRESGDFLRRSVVSEIKSGRMPKASSNTVRPVVLELKIDTRSIDQSVKQFGRMLGSIGTRLG